MQLFYVKDLQIGTLALPPDEARHAVQVLRKRVGDTLQLVDGRGGWYEGTITGASKRDCTLEVRKLRQDAKRNAYTLTMCVSPTKNNDRFEWFLEKATEIGVDRIIPVQCKRTERSKIRLDRYEKILVSAMKQSLQAWLPVIEPLQSLKAVLDKMGDQPEQQRYIGWCEDMTQKVDLIDNYQPAEDVCIFIGPEGDFTPQEVDAALAVHCQPITLGPTRLRVETAALVAAQTVAVLYQLQTKK